MKKIPHRSSWIVFAGVAAAVCWSGCATPSYRIGKNPEVYERFPPAIQAKVSAGEIDIGYDRDMVHIALGWPDRVYHRKTAEGVEEIWAYMQYYGFPDHRDSPACYYLHSPRRLHSHVRNRSHTYSPTGYYYERLRVILSENRVIAIEGVAKNTDTRKVSESAVTAGQRGQKQ